MEGTWVKPSRRRRTRPPSWSTHVRNGRLARDLSTPARSATCSADSTFRANSTTDETPRSSSNGSSGGGVRPSKPTANMRATDEASSDMRQRLQARVLSGNSTPAVDRLGYGLWWGGSPFDRATCQPGDKIPLKDEEQHSHRQDREQG